MNKKIYVFAVGIIVLLMGFSACDPCKDVSCLNGGICDEGDCLCVGDYEGDDCGTHKIEKFLGTYSVATECDGSAGTPFECTITEDADVTNGIVFGNFWRLTNNGAPAGDRVIGTVDLETNLITIPAQTVWGVAFEATSATLDGVSFTVTHVGDDNGIVRTCTDVFTKN